MSLKHFVSPKSFSHFKPVKSFLCLSTLQSLLPRPLSTSHPYQILGQLPVASEHLYCCKHLNKKAKYISPPFYLCSACAVQFAQKQKPIYPINDLNLSKGLDIGSQRQDDSLDLSIKEGKVEEIIKNIDCLIAKLRNNNQSQQIKDIFSQKEAYKSEVYKNIDAIKSKLEKETQKQLDKIEKLHDTNLEVLDKIQKKTMAYSKRLKRMKQLLTQKYKEFFLNDEDLCKLMADYKATMEHIGNYNQTAQNLSLLVQKISQNQEKSSNCDEFQLIQKSRVLKNNSYRTPRIDRSDNKQQAIISTVDVISPKKQITFKAMATRTLKKRSELFFNSPANQ